MTRTKRPATLRDSATLLRPATHPEPIVRTPAP